ncbi:MAG: hypothetical protein GX974_06845 [Clostridiales bacterium]|nr:hypothetical protein [Clostridiales bacterium]
MEINEKRDAVIWGAGKIGRGFLAEIFHNAGYNINFVEYDNRLVRGLKKAGSYTIHKISGVNAGSEIKIGNFDIIQTDDVSEIKEKLKGENKIVAIAVHKGALSSIAKVLSTIIEYKAESEPENYLDIIFCVNMHRPSVYFRELLIEHLSSKSYDYLNKNVGLIDSVVMRICPEPTEKLLKKDPFVVLTNGYDKMPVDAKGFKGKVPDTDMLKLSTNIVAEEVRKIYTLNMSHAALAYMGSYEGYKYAHEAIKDNKIRSVIVGALKEVGEALMLEYDFNTEDMRVWNQDIVEFIENPALNDSLIRLGSDPKRKLAAGDRLAGPAALCAKYDIFPGNIGKAIAYGFKFKDSKNTEEQELCEYAREKGIGDAIKKYSKLTDERLISHIKDIYEKF